MFDCTYLETPTNLGVAGSRNFGVTQCDTQYFRLLDAHMRFYDDNWHENILDALDKNPDSLVSSNTVVFSYDKKTGLYKNEEGSNGRDRFGTFGAIVNFSEPGWEFTAKWTEGINEDFKDSKDTLIPISCCLGAVYATSKTLWIKLGGLNGLIKYGLDEPLISLKVWLAGGKVLMFKDWGVGHLYRGVSPYSVPLDNLDQNQIYLINLFSMNDEDVFEREQSLMRRIGITRFNKAKELFNQQYQSFVSFKDYFYNKVAKHDLNWFIENINNKIK